jgi:hypothetical protein
MFLIVAAIVAPMRPAAADEYTYPGDRQWIYCAERAEECYLFCQSHMDCPQPDTMFVFIYANDPLGVTHAHFRLEADYPCCDSIRAVIPCPGVVIESGDIEQGMTIAFPLFVAGHFKALALAIRHDAQDPPFTMSDHGFWIRDAWLERPNAQTITVLDYRTLPLYPDCYWTSRLWYHPDTVDVYIGSQTDVRIQWEQNGPGYPGPVVEVADEKGWLSSTKLYLRDTGCLTCPWHIQTEHIYVIVPEGTPVGTLSTLALPRTFGPLLETLVLRAVPPIAVEQTPWGAIKKIFR